MLTFANGSTAGVESEWPGRPARAGAMAGAFRHLPLSDSTLLVWVYRFDTQDPYRPVPNEAALQFAPTHDARAVDSHKNNEGIQATDAGAGEQGASARDTRLLRWLWGWDRNGASNTDKGSGGVRQHFIGSAAWEGRPDEARRTSQEEEDLQRAISLSLVESRNRGQRAPEGGAEAVVELLDEEEAEPGP